jgi:hypothetical protein
LYFVQIQVFMDIAYRDKKVVSAQHFRAPFNNKSEVIRSPGDRGMTKI